MKLKELLEELRNIPEDAEVCILVNEEGQRLRAADCVEWLSESRIVCIDGSAEYHGPHA